MDGHLVAVGAGEHGARGRHRCRPWPHGLALGMMALGHDAGNLRAWDQRRLVAALLRSLTVRVTLLVTPATDESQCGVLTLDPGAYRSGSAQVVTVTGRRHTTAEVDVLLVLKRADSAPYGLVGLLSRH